MMLTNTGIIFLLFCLSVASGEFGEPKCFSKYDYDEKMLLKLLKIEDKVQKFEDFINELKESREMDKVKRRELFDSEMDLFKAQNAEEIHKQQNLTAEMLELWNDAMKKLEDASQEKEKSQKKDIVAFTVKTPVNVGGSTSVLTFDTILTNEGGAFDKSTGRFTSPVNGLYYFTLHMVKKRTSPSVDYAGCHVYLNGVSKVKAYIDPQDGSSGADGGSYGVSNSVYLRLSVGDVIRLENCSGGADALESWSSFSGYLERQDE